MRAIFTTLLILSVQAAFAQQRYIKHYQDANGKYGYKNEQGQIVVEPKYDYAQIYPTCGLALVNIGGTKAGFGYEGGNWSYIDSTGQEVIKLGSEFYKATVFEGDKALLVKDKAKTIHCYINKKGQIITQTGKQNYTNGATYNGELTADLSPGGNTAQYGLRHGKGTIAWTNGDRYEGDWNFGQRHGAGRYTYANGNVEEGQFVNNVFQGGSSTSVAVNNSNGPDNKERADAIFKRGVDNLRAGNFDDAIRDYTEYLAISRNSAAYLNRGLSYKEKRSREPARSYQEEARIYAGLKPDEAPPKSENSTHAIADFSEVIRLDPTNYIAYYSRAEVYRMENDWGPAMKDYQKVTALNPDYQKYPSLKNLTETIIRNRNQYAPDLQLLALDIGVSIANSKHYEATAEGEALAKSQKKTAENEVIYKGLMTKAARTFSPMDWYTYNGRGGCYKAIKNWDAAIADYTEALQLKPDEIYTLEALAACYNESGQFQKAISTYDHILTMPLPDSEKSKKHPAHIGRAAVLGKLGKLDEAIAELDNVITANPEHYAAHFDRGLLYAKKGNKELARADLTKAAETPNLSFVAREQIALLDGK
ncbi:tetratricopeptide repeat protein [Parapedobacter sp. 2B3]|uniref:tetratricopeptide repeat protein n=1 Tax=Parapedobacter sp. 2B3 TaxID=3342381 RepID=UPI0035B665A3